MDEMDPNNIDLYPYPWSKCCPWDLVYMGEARTEMYRTLITGI